jgi:hypothetical protein
LLGTDSFISVISAWCWISKTLVYCNYNRGSIVFVLQTQRPFKIYT